MFHIGSYVQIRENGCLGQVIRIASARQVLSIQTVEGDTLRAKAEEVRPLDRVEWISLRRAVDQIG